MKLPSRSMTNLQKTIKDKVFKIEIWYLLSEKDIIISHEIHILGFQLFSRLLSTFSFFCVVITHLTQSSDRGILFSCKNREQIYFSFMEMVIGINIYWFDISVLFSHLQKLLLRFQVYWSSCIQKKLNRLNRPE